MGLQSEESLALLQLADLAARGGDSKHEDLYVGMAGLFGQRNKMLTQRERVLVTQILRHLTHEVEMSIRVALAERLADDPNAPHELVLMLADDKIEVARPVLARSPVLTEEDLVALIEVTTPEHHIIVASRPEIGEAVSAALARGECEAVLVALLRNMSARIGGQDFDHLVELARTTMALQEPLVSRRDLPHALASKMYHWVSISLKTAIAQRFPAATVTVSRTMHDATSTAMTGSPPPPEHGAAKLIEKLAAANQLRASFLIRVLQQGQMELFELGFAKLLGISPHAVRRALYEDRPAMVALACRAVGIDVSVFKTVYELSRQRRNITRILTDDDRDEVHAVFGTVTKPAALQRLRTSLAA